MNSNCFVFISVIFLLLLTSEASKRICPRNSPIKAECGKTFKTFSSKTNGARKHNRIAGGYDAKPGEFPSFVTLDIESSSPGFCSGVLIDTDVVLTAAHCLLEKIRAIWVSHGSKSWTPSGVHVYRAKHFCAAPEYNYDKNSHDYAIVKLEKHVQLSDVLQTACLPNRPISDSTQAYTVGTGKMDDMRTGWPKVAQVLPVESFDCDVKEREQTHICFRSNDPNHTGVTCPGDSGGPTYTSEGDKMVVNGVSSYRVNSSRCEKGIIDSTVMADVFEVKKHILELIELCDGSRANNLIDYNDDGGGGGGGGLNRKRARDQNASFRVDTKTDSLDEISLLL